MANEEWVTTKLINLAMETHCIIKFERDMVFIDVPNSIPTEKAILLGMWIGMLGEHRGCNVQTFDN
jgi:hypothetical protein